MENNRVVFHDLLEMEYHDMEDRHAGPITSVAFSPDCKKLASASKDGTILVWNTVRRELITPILGPEAERGGLSRNH